MFIAFIHISRNFWMKNMLCEIMQEEKFKLKRYKDDWFVFVKAPWVIHFLPSYAFQQNVERRTRIWFVMLMIVRTQQDFVCFWCRLHNFTMNTYLWQRRSDNVDWLQMHVFALQNCISLAHNSPSEHTSHTQIYGTNEYGMNDICSMQVQRNK